MAINYEDKASDSLSFICRNSARMKCFASSITINAVIDFIFSHVLLTPGQSISRNVPPLWQCCMLTCLIFKLESFVFAKRNNRDQGTLHALPVEVTLA